MMADRQDFRVFNTDWDMLAEQKAVLADFATLDASKVALIASMGGENVDALAGMLEWVDAAMDYFAGVVGEDVVFPGIFKTDGMSVDAVMEKLSDVDKMAATMAVRRAVAQTTVAQREFTCSFCSHEYTVGFDHEGGDALCPECLVLGAIAGSV